MKLILDMIRGEVCMNRRMPVPIYSLKGLQHLIHGLERRQNVQHCYLSTSGTAGKRQIDQICTHTWVGIHIMLK